MKLDKLSRTDIEVGVAGAILAISVLFFPWFSASLSVGPISTSYSTTGTGSPDGFLGVLALLAAVAAVADLLIERYSPATQIPPLGGSREVTRFILACVAAACVVLKFLLHIHFNYFGWGFYITVIAAGVMVYAARQARNGPLT